jgi:hypothetical protein
LRFRAGVTLGCDLPGDMECCHNTCSSGVIAFDLLRLELSSGLPIKSISGNLVAGVDGGQVLFGRAFSSCLRIALSAIEVCGGTFSFSTSSSLGGLDGRPSMN